MPSHSSTLRLVTLLRPYAGRMLMAAVVGALTIVSSIGLMFTSSWLIATAALQPTIAELGVSVVLVRAFGIGRAGFRYLERIAGHQAAFRLLGDLRVAFYDAVEPLAPAVIRQWRTGDLHQRVIADVESLQNVYLRALAPAGSALVVTLAAVLFLSLLDPWIGLTVALVMVLTGVGHPLLTWRLSWLPGREAAQLRSAYNVQMADYTLGMTDLLANGAHLRWQARIATTLSRLEAAERRSARGDAVSQGVGMLLSGGAMLTVLIIASARLDGVLVAACALATAAAFEAFTPLSAAAHQWGHSSESARRLFELEAMPRQAPRLLDPCPVGDLVFEHVDFRHGSDLPLVVRDFNARIPYGAHVTITGPSGAGKSTLVNLVAGFEQPSGGRIALGGVDITRVEPEALRTRLGIQMQRADLFNTSILENIRLARPDASDEDVERVAEMVQLGPWIERLPDGIRTIVGESGATISGGQRQRIAAARVILRDAPIWILDEPTAHLDRATADALMRAIEAAAEGRTLIVMQHEADKAIEPAEDQTLVLAV
ncbi:MAG: thiol reductant ABC exporter subunit CydC [Chloroflexi bacterium]|nr:thiol reductant ABC exporter subunit CydC [Chloroflexota bacterium]